MNYNTTFLHVARIFSFACIYYMLCIPIAYAQTRPDAIPNLHVWLRADSGVVVVNDKVSIWEDVGPKSFDALQEIVANRPGFSATAINGAPAISFNGTDSYMTFPIHLMNGVSELSFFFVLNVKTMNKNAGIFGSNMGYFCFEFGTISNTGFLRIRQNSGTPGVYSNAELFNPIESWNMVSIQARNLNGRVWKNGVSLVTNTTNAQLPILANTQKALGRYAGEYGNFYALFDIAEFIAFDRDLTQLERQEVEDYLRLKYFPSEYRPKLDLGADIVEPYSLAPVTISVPAQAYYQEYLWNTGDITSSISVSKSGQYWVDVWDERGYLYTDTISVTLPFISHISDTTICIGDAIVWDCGLSGAYTYTWSTGAATQSIIITDADQYWVEVEDSFGNTLHSDTLTVAVSTFPVAASLGPDTDLCEGNFIELQSRKSDAILYLWSTGEVSSEIIITAAGEYSLIAEDIYGCQVFDTIQLGIKGLAPVVRMTAQNRCFGDNTLLENTTTMLDDSQIILYNWIIAGDTLSGSLVNHQFANPGTTAVRVMVETDAGCPGILDTTVFIGYTPQSNFIPPRGCTAELIEFVNLAHIPQGFIAQTVWQIEGNNRSGNTMEYLFDTVGVFPIYVQTISDMGCIHDTIIPIEIRQSANLEFAYGKTCQNEKILFFDKTKYEPFNRVVDGNWYINGQKFPQLSVFGHTFTSPGQYVVTLEVKTINGCKTSVSDTLTIFNAPVFDSLKIYGCVNQDIELREYTNTFGHDIVSYRWNIDSIGIRVEEAPVVQFKQVGEYPFALEITTEKECIGKASGIVYVEEPPRANFTFFPEFGATPLEVDFTNTSQGAVRYEWRFEFDSRTQETNPRYEFSYIDTSYAFLHVYSKYECVDSVVKRIPIDLALQRLQLVQLSYKLNARGFIEYTIDVVNTGNAPIHMIEFILDNPLSPLSLETWKGKLQPGNLLSYTFVSKTEQVKGQTPPYLCATANLISQDIYRVFYSDTLCEDFDKKFHVYAIAPNPADTEITIHMTMVNSGDITIECIDARGRRALVTEYQSVSPGVHYLPIDVSSLAQGTYTLVIRNNARRITELFTIYRE